ncbi:MAG: PQQ-dependent sugar dehydrogenase [Acidobacteriota bacterium]|nr:PQQ-dependent sugar dehydrogenase [Acidobacteriota bacterium]
MKRKTATRMTRIAAFLLAAGIAGQAVAQTGYGGGGSGLPRVELPDEPWIMNTHLIPEVKVSVVVRGINRPWSLAFLPKGDMLVTERGGDLRLVRDGVLVDEPIAGVPDDVLARHAKLAQDPNSHAGKTLRLRLDGSVPDDNPFVGKEGHKPEIYSMGHRNQMGLALHPETNQPWTTEHAPQGGDELNAIEAGKNYGWPVVSYGRHYNGVRISERFWAEGMEEPAIFWLPSIAPSGLAFYTGDAFPQWKGNLFAGALMTGRMPNTGHLERLIFSPKGEELGREWLLKEIGKRIRDVRQGPDDFIYVITDERDGAVIRLEPAEKAEEAEAAVG